MPEQLLGRIIRACSNPGELVLDPFGGSGTTLVVAKKLHRRFLGFELSPDYAAAIRRRLEDAHPGQPLSGSPEPTARRQGTRLAGAGAMTRAGPAMDGSPGCGMTGTGVLSSLAEGGGPSMTRTVRGVVHGHQIAVDEDLGLAEGQVVELTIRVVPPPPIGGPAAR